MIATASLLRNERGLALPMALLCLLTLTGLVLAFLTVSAFEPQISANHAQGTQARFAAEAGIEWAFDYLIANNNWNTVLTGATASGKDITPAQPWVGATANMGTFTVTVRNDTRASDTQITGVASDAAGSATSDTNNIVILTAVGTFGNSTRTITVAVKKAVLPTINAALALPGVQADVNFSGSAFNIYGTDWNMDGTAGSAQPVFGISVAGGNTVNQTTVQNAIANNQQNDVQGISPSSPPPPAAPVLASGDAAVVNDYTLTSQQVTDFVNAVKSQADVTIDVSNGSTASYSDVGSSCSSNINSNTCFGTPSHPKIVYVKGDLTSSLGQFTGLDISGNSTGTGILIVEGTNASINGDFTWNGPIIVTGNNVGLQYRGGGNGGIFGAILVNELTNEPNLQFESDVRGNGNIRYSRQALDLVQNTMGRKFYQVYSWREQ
jgi:Tfp pilus assembly protein PilX